MKILSIETSCDETGITVLECHGDTAAATFTVLGNALYSQAHLHAEYGGVYPTLAKREHIKNLLPLTLQALGISGSEASDLINNKNIDLIAVTQGPGLEPALWTGIEFAKKLGAEWGVPVIGIDHMEGHICSALAEQITDTEYQITNVRFPILALLISGGHTQLVLMKQWFVYEHIGATRDDAVGEAFDKVARMLDLEYPGGPKIEKLAEAATARGAVHNIVFPRPMAHDSTCDFSFSGLKTAVLYKLRDMPALSDFDKEHVAQAFQDAARDVIVIKTERALHETDAKTLAVGGGVSASKNIRKGLEQLVEASFPDVSLKYPGGALHLDNAIMIGMAAYLRHAMHAPTNELVARGTQTLAVIPSK